jgi:hypothetical protein
MPRLPGGKDIITQPLYDSGTFTSASTTALTFFSTPLGSGTTSWGGTAAKNLVDTNMVLAGQLPSPWTFDIFTVQVQLQPNITAADAVALMNAVSFELIIGAKTWLQIPAICLAGGAGINPSGVTTSVSSNGFPDPRSVFALSRPITLLENENFAGRLVWNAAVTLAVSPQAVRVLFGGELSRSIQ